MKAILLSRKPVGVNEDVSYFSEKHVMFYGAQNKTSGLPVRLVDDTPPVVSERDHPSLPGIIQSKIKRGTDCVVRQINPVFYLREGELLVSDSFSYLSKAYLEYAEDTVVLTRKTNMGEFYFVFPDIKAKRLYDDATGVTLVDIVDGGRSLYPIPPKASLSTSESVVLDSSLYMLTEVKPTSGTTIYLGWSVPDATKSDVWWGLYRGVMPDWSGLDSYTNWDWLFPKGTTNTAIGSETITVSRMSSGAIYTLALFSSGWNLTDYQTFNAP
jgi:hypothetical protein